MYFISSGAVEIRRPGQEEAVRLGRGDFVGEMALISGQPRSADAVALSYCRLLLLDAADFEAFLKANPEVRDEVEAVTQAREAENLAQDGADQDDAMAGVEGMAPADAGQEGGSQEDDGQDASPKDRQAG